MGGYPWGEYFGRKIILMISVAFAIGVVLACVVGAVVILWALL